MPAWKSYQCTEHIVINFLCCIRNSLFSRMNLTLLSLTVTEWTGKYKSLFYFHSSILGEFHVTIQFKIILYKLISFSQISFEISFGICLPALQWRKKKYQQTNLISLFSSVCWTNYQLQVKEKWFMISILTPI